MKENNKYYTGFQILRAIAFLFVFFCHVTVLNGAFSRWSITVFLMLSGFLNALHGYDKRLPHSVKNSFEYATGKIKKIYPLHLVMLVIAFGLFVISDRQAILSDLGHRVPFGVLKLISNITLVSDWGPKSGIFYQVFSEYNIVTWYLSLSLLLFWLTPFFMHIMHKVYDRVENTLKSLIVIICIYIITILINLVFVKIFGTSGAFLYTYEWPLSRAGDYLIALQLGYVFMSKNAHNGSNSTLDTNDNIDSKSLKLWNFMTIIAIILSGALLYLGAAVLSLDNQWIVSSGFYYTIPVAILVYGAARLEPAISAGMKKNRILALVAGIMIYIGNISLYSYLIHVPVINLVHGIYQRLGEVSVPIWAVLSFTITMALAIFVYKKNKRVISK